MGKASILTVRNGRDSLSLSYRTLNKMLHFSLSEKFVGYNQLRDADIVFLIRRFNAY